MFIEKYVLLKILTTFRRDFIGGMSFSYSFIVSNKTIYYTEPDASS